MSRCLYYACYGLTHYLSFIHCQLALSVWSCLWKHISHLKTSMIAQIFVLGEISFLVGAVWLNWFHICGTGQRHILVDLHYWLMMLNAHCRTTILLFYFFCLYEENICLMLKYCSRTVETMQIVLCLKLILCICRILHSSSNIYFVDGMCTD